ncbi:MAG: Chromosome partition protein Smc [Verrucomicrobiota bacterium]|jgi:hypothetical protein
MRIVRLLFTGACAAALAARAGEPAKKITYEDDVLPIFRNNCLKCHNPDKLKGDLDLSSFSGALKGGAGGVDLNAGDPDGSQLYKSVTHSDEPTMPPNAKLPDRDILTIRRWIEGGLLQGVNSKAIAANKPTADLSLKAAAVGRPEGPPVLPGGLALEPVVRAERGTAVNAIACSPWAPVVALAGTRQIAFYGTDDAEYLGVWAFPEGQVCDVKFSRNGKLLIAGGGQGGKSGVVAVWNVATGERVITIGDQFDSVLAADLSADQQWIALGGPDRVLKIYRTKDGGLEHRIRKHTDWVTALEFSPDGKYLASGDRAGGLVQWETESGQPMFTLTGHKGAITAITWRDDAEMFASASEDGTLKIWKASDGSAVRSANAHAGGVLAARFAHDGRVVTSGRDNKVQVWDATGKNVATPAFAGELPNRVAFSDDGARVIAGDWKGNILVCDAKSGKVVGELESSPPPLGERVQRLVEKIATLEGALRKAIAAQASAAVDAATADAEADKAKKTLAEAKARVATLDRTAKPAATGEAKTAKADAKAAASDAKAAKTDAQAASSEATATTAEAKAPKPDATVPKPTGDEAEKVQPVGANAAAMLAAATKRAASLEKAAAAAATQATAAAKKATEAATATDELRVKLAAATKSLAKWRTVLQESASKPPAGKLSSH